MEQTAIELEAKKNPTLIDTMKVIKKKYYIPNNLYLIVVSNIYNYHRLSVSDKEKLRRNSKKITTNLMEKFNPLVIFMNAGRIVMIFNKRETGNHKFKGKTDVINGVVTSYLTHITCELVENLWFVTNSFGEEDKKMAYAFLLYNYRRAKMARVDDYIKTFSKEELKPVEFKKIKDKLEYIQDLVGIEYDEEENKGFFTKYKKVENPESKFGFDRVIKHIDRDIWFFDKDIDYIMSEYI